MISRLIRYINKPQVTLVILWLLFFVPPILAVWSYTHNGLWQRGASNHGLLIKNPPSLTTANLQHSQTRGRWNLWVLQPNQTQQQSLYTINQVRKALGKEKMRIGRLTTVTDTAQIAPLQNIIQKEFEGIEVATIDKVTLEKIFAKNPQANEWIQHGAIFIVDPIGNIVLAYRVDEKPSPIFSDLRHLLSVSRIG